MQPAELESRLQEWRTWLLSGRHHRGRCQSAEGSYRSPQIWDPITWAPQMPIVASRAFAVELQVVSLADPWKVTLTLVYVRLDRPESVRRVLRRKGFRVTCLADVAAVLEEARHRVAAGLDGGTRARSQVPSYLHMSAPRIIA